MPEDQLETIVVISVGAFIVIPLLISMVLTVPGKTAKILETFGRPHRNARLPGLSIKAPWPITQVIGTVNLQLREISADVSAKTLDNAFMTVPVKVQYRASSEPDGAVKAHYELENHEQQISSYVLNTVRQSVSAMSMEDLYKHRDQMESDVKGTLLERFARFGFAIENVLVDEPEPSIEVRNAFNRVIASEREKEAARNVADARKIELVGVASAEKESKRLQGEGIADMREAIARGMKDAMTTLTDAGLSSDQALKLLMDTNRLDTLGSAAAHGNMVLVDMHASHGEALAHNIMGVRASQGGKVTS